jgi:hypothetical protein
MTLEELKQEIDHANLVLVGLGEELKGEKSSFLKGLAQLLNKKDYYIVTLQGRKELEEAGLIPEQITAPLDEGEDKESWDQYLHWLGFTLNQKLCVLELGVGFQYPNVIRFPFERTSYFNQKSRYIRINAHFPQLSAEIADRGISVEMDPIAFITEEQLQGGTE